MQVREKHFVGNRPILFAFVALIVGILLAFSFVYNLPLMVLLIVLTFLTVVLLLARRKFTACIVICVSLLVGILSFVITFGLYNNKVIEEDNYKVVGRVSDIYIKEANYSIVTLEDCHIFSDDEMVTNGKVSLFVSGGGGFTYGDKIEFYATVSSEPFTEFGTPSYSVLNGVFYDATVSNQDIKVLDNYLLINEQIRIAFKEKIESYFQPSEAGLAYALIFGDRQLLDASIVESFQYSGIAHLLAVSGVNVTIMFGLLGALVNRLRINKFLKLFILTVPVVLFLWLCSFAPSVCRAGIMFLIMYFASVVFKRYDALNGLAITGIVLLLVNPLDIFNAGFLLSFSCILGMILFNNFFIEKLSFLKNNFLQLAVATCVSTTITTLPFMLQFFGYFSVFGLLTNFILMPVFEFAFIAMMIVVFIGFILPLQPFFSIVGELLASIIYISKVIADLDYSIIYVLPFSMTMSVLFTYLIFIISRKVMIEKKFKAIIVGVLCVVIGLSAVIGVYKNYSNVSLVNTSNHSIVIRDEQTSVIAFPSKTVDISTIKRFSSGNMITSIDNIVLTDTNFIALDKLRDFVDRYNVDNIYILENCYSAMAYVVNDEIIGNKTSLMLFDTAYDLGYNVVVRSYSKESFYFDITKDAVTVSLIDSSRFKPDDLGILIESLNGKHYIVDGISGSVNINQEDSFCNIKVEGL